MMNSSVTVSAELGLSLVVPEHGSVPLVASLFYSADDPYAIRMAFHVGTDDPVGGPGHFGCGSEARWALRSRSRPLELWHEFGTATRISRLSAASSRTRLRQETSNP